MEGGGVEGGVGWKVGWFGRWGGVEGACGRVYAGSGAWGLGCGTGQSDKGGTTARELRSGLETRKQTTRVRKKLARVSTL